jgi:hypothetical protein
MTVSTTDIPILHSADVTHLYTQVVLPICHGVDRTLYTSTKKARQGNITRPLQSSTSFRKLATISRGRRNPSYEHLSQQNQPESLPILTTPLLPLPLSGKVVLH